MAYALKTSCAKNIIGVIPYFPYSKQCKMRKRGSIVSKLLASMLAKAGKDNTTKAHTCRLRLSCSSTLFGLHRVDAHYHHGLASEGDPGFLHLPCGQPACVPLPDPVHPGRGDLSELCVCKVYVCCTHTHTVDASGPPSLNLTDQVYVMC